MFEQLHVIYLAKKLKSYYGIDVEDWDSLTKSSSCKISDQDRKALYDIFVTALDKTYTILTEEEPYEKLEKLRLEVIEATKFIH
jgi:hypothetical protein